MKKVTVSIFVLLLSITYHLFPIPSLAHFVKSDGTIGTLLHMDPEDDPIVGASSNIILEFKDTQNKFNLNDCACKIQIFENGKELSTLDLNPVSDNELLTAITPFTFPQKDVYQLKITGSPKNGASFSNFELNYDVRVEREITTANAQNNTSPSWFSAHLIPLVGAGVVAVFFIAALIIPKKKGGVS